MIPRYEDPQIAAIFNDAAKTNRWLEVELAVIQARVRMGLVHELDYVSIAGALGSTPCDIAWWHHRESITRHDLAAWVDERMRHLPPTQQHRFHQDMTSYDTEDPAFALALYAAAEVVRQRARELDDVLVEQALRYRNTVMLERTHGQWAKLRSFGGRILTWLAPLRFAIGQLDVAMEQCRFSRLSGAIGNYGGGLYPKLESEALSILGLKPFYGSTQILPRIVQAPLAQALQLVAEAVAQIAMDFRLGARSGFTLWQEPFGKGQKGSSAMPHKKNTIATEQMGGMLAFVQGLVASILASIRTWEGRAIEQSCVERMAWPDLFHTATHMLTTMRRVMQNMVVYPETMMREIVEAHGTYASDEAKNDLAERLARLNVPFETAYRIVQLAAHNVAPTLTLPEIHAARHVPCLAAADTILDDFGNLDPRRHDSIRDVILECRLEPDQRVGVTDAMAEEWNELLRRVFDSEAECEKWRRLFKPSHLIAQEAHLFRQILGVE